VQGLPSRTRLLLTDAIERHAVCPTATGPGAGGLRGRRKDIGTIWF
jgi:hypothetical protein